MKKRWIWLVAVLIVAALLMPSPLSGGVGERESAAVAVRQDTGGQYTDTTQEPTQRSFSTPRPTTRPMPTPAPESDTATYVLNTNTHKFHYPYCSSVGQMKESNKWFYEGTREEIIAMGYEPCGRCKP